MKRIVFVFVALCIGVLNNASAQDYVLNAPNTLSWTTCGAVNNCAYSLSEEHVIQVNIPCSGDWEFSLCGGSTNFNTNLFLSTGICSGTLINSNDDFCGQYSQFTETLTAGIYYITIEGAAAGDCGDYTLFVSDVEPPVIVNCQSDITVNNDPGDCGAVINFSTPSASDNCVLTSFTGTHTSGSLFPVGTTTVTFTAVDGAGNTAECSFDITVNDNESPIISNCPANITTGNTSGQCGKNVSWAVPVANDNCAVNSFTSTHSPGASFPVGTTTVIYTATDNSGNSTTCTFTVTINDIENPQLSCPANISVSNDAGDCGAVVNYSVTGTDNCPGVVTTLSAGLSSGSFFPLGTTTVSYLATDAASNTSTCSFTVTVVDDETPVFNCPSDMLVCGDNSVVTFSIPSFTDNCPGASAVQVSGPSSGSTFAVGTHTVSFEVTDAAGNASSCSYDIVVAHNPVADYGYSTSCAGDLIFFTEFSTIPIGTVDSYSWDMGDGSGLITIRNPVYQYPDTGTYTVSLTVTSDMGCTNTHTETVIITDVPSASFNVAPQCAGLQVVFNNTSTIITGDLDYVWDFGDGTTGLGDDPVHTYANPGTYTVILTVTSIDGCVDDFSSTVNILASPLANFTTHSLTCYDDATGELNITGYGSLSPYQYSLDGGSNFQPSGLFSNLDAGSYTALVEDDNGCQSSYSFTLTEPTLLDASLVTSVDLNCNGDQDGSLQVSVSGGVTPYLYTVDNISYQLSPIFQNLEAGDYSVYITDDNGCADTVDVTLSEPTATALSVYVQTNVQCNGENSGYLELLATGGVTPYMYSINGGQTFQSQPSFYNLYSGTYNVVVKDDNDCQQTLTAIVTQPSQLAFTADVDDVNCFGENNGAIVISATGGTAPYQYSSDGGLNYQPSSTFSNLVTNNYVISVKDAHNCTVSGGAFVNEPSAALEASITSLQDVLCRGGNSGMATIEAEGGTETYMYSIDGGQNFQLSNIFEGLVLGDYAVIVNDHNGCADTVTLSLDEPAENLRIDLVVVEDVLCSGEESGYISIVAGGGTPAYEYSIDEGANYQSSQNFNELSGGTYYIILRDENGCIVADTAELDEPFTAVALTFNGSTNVACENDTTGTINISGSGGTPPYLYSLDGGNGQLSGIFGSLSNGTYTAQVRDLNGCTAIQEITIDAVSYLPNANFAYQVAGQSVAFTNQTGGAQSYDWNFGDGATSTASNPTHLYAAPGQYTVTLIGTNTCGPDTMIKNISTIVIGVEEIENLVSAIYPNPANEQFTLNLASKENLSNLAVNIHSIDGRLVFAENYAVQGNAWIHTFSTHNFADGIYIIQISSDETTKSSLITITH